MSTMCRVSSSMPARYVAKKAACLPALLDALLQPGHIQDPPRLWPRQMTKP